MIHPRVCNGYNKTTMSEQVIKFLKNELLGNRESAVQVKQSDCYVPGSENQYVERIRKLLVKKFGWAILSKCWEENNIEAWLQVLRKLICIIHDESGKWVIMERDHPRDFQPELKRIYLTRYGGHGDGGDDLTDSMVKLVHDWFQEIFLTRLLGAELSPPPNVRRFIVPGIYFTGILGLLYLLNKSRTF